MTISKYRRAFRKPAQQRKKGTRVLSDIDLEDNLGSVEDFEKREKLRRPLVSHACKAALAFALGVAILFYSLGKVEPGAPCEDLVVPPCDRNDFFSNHPASSCRQVYRKADPAVGIPLVSVITPFICNKLKYIPETIESLRRQSLSQIEVIIVNDGCTDPEVAAFFKELNQRDPRFRAITTDKVGVSLARNIGVRKARGEFIFFLDADDLIEPTTLEKLWWALSTNPALSFANGFSVGFGAKNYTWYHGFHEGEVFLKENMVTVTAMVRKNTFEYVGGFTSNDINGNEDWDFWLKCAAHGFWGATIPEFTDWYRQRPTRASDWSAFSDPAKAQDQFRERYPALYSHGNISHKYHHINPSAGMTIPFNILPRPPARRRILMIIPWMVTGGADRFNLNLLNYLVNTGWDVTVAATLPWRPNPWKRQDWEDTFRGYTEDVFILSNFLSDATSMADFLAYLVMSRQPDIVFISNSEMAYASMPLMKWAAEEYCDNVYFVDYNHMHEVEWHDGGFPRFAIEKQQFFDVNVVVAEYLRDWMTENGGKRDDIQICYAGASKGLEVNSTASSALRAELNIPASDTIILYAARIVEQKQPHVLAASILELTKLNTAFTLVVAGDGELMPELREMMQPVSDKVRFMGAIEADRMQNVLQASDVVFLPSKMEGLSLMVFDAMALGKVFVGAAVGGHAEVITPDCNCGYLIQRSDAEKEAAQYSTILNTLVGDHNLRQAVGDAAAKRIKDNFTSAHTERCISGIFDDFITKRSKHNLGLPYAVAKNESDTGLANLAPWNRP